MPHWDIRIGGPTVYNVVSDENLVEIAYPAIHPLHSVDITAHRFTQTHAFSLSIDSKRVSIHLRSLSATEVDSLTDNVSVELTPSGYCVSVGGVGRVEYRRKVGIESIGFTDRDWELAMVWLIGTLFITAFPHKLD